MAAAVVADAVAAEASAASGGAVVLSHPLLAQSIAALRSVETGTDAFRRHARVVAQILALRVLEDLPVRTVRVQTPLEECDGALLDRGVIFVPVLRAGLALLEVMHDFVPGSSVGFVGLERDEETAIARSYYQKLPHRLAEAEVIILDPMLATGGSALATVELLKRHSAARIRLACVVAAPEGIALLNARHPDVRIYAAVVDRTLNERKYILPGLGDFGDRYFGTT